MRLRRDLGTLESYAALIGILIGAGIFRVTSEAGAMTGPSVILAYLVLAPAVLAGSIAYAVFLSTPLGLEPGGEYLHISRTFGGFRIAFVGAWLKIISYLGALAYLSSAFADYSLRMATGRAPSGPGRLGVAAASLIFFYLVHLAGVRWFGRLQVTMCALLGLSLIVLIVPGLLAIRPANYSPFFTKGAAGFTAALAPLFFSYAGFESVAQAAGEVRNSTRRLPAVFLRGIGITTAIFLLMSVVAFGVLPLERLAGSSAPMVEVAEAYLPAGGSWFVNLGALMALATSLNATMLVPSRMALMLASDHLAPGWLSSIFAPTGTPAVGLTLTLAASMLLLVSGQLGMALNIAVLALVMLYFLHSLALLLLPRRNPELLAQAAGPMTSLVRTSAAVFSLLTMGALILLMVAQDIRLVGATSFRERIAGQSLTSLELVVFWAAVGSIVYALSGRRRRPA
ncbi:MAG TPA: APC family permease [Candidatus Polarisedimenticolia bacterium]|nr:APC family permease [Candidatus Polarisedimenticolia bacterium]